MTLAHDSQYPWVIFRLGTGYYAISAHKVESLVKLADVNVLPNQPSHIRGIMNLRGRIVQLLDLRVRLGLPSTMEDIHSFMELMDARRRDHENWLAELRKSTEESRPFTLTTNPHLCAFGRWYDAYKPNDPVLMQLLKQFDAPHRYIHSIAEKVEQLKEAGKPQEALALIDACWNGELNTMVILFDALKIAYQESKREIAMILNGSEAGHGIIVDEVVAVEHLKQEPFTAFETILPPGNMAIDLSSLAVGKRQSDDAMVLIAQEPEIFFAGVEESG